MVLFGIALMVIMDIVMAKSAGVKVLTYLAFDLTFAHVVLASF